MDTTAHRRIISLKAERVKRIKAVHIKPDGNLMVITGKNDQGKTSVLDAITLALGGKKFSGMVDEALRQNEKEGHVEINLGDVIVTRTWKRKKGKIDSTIVVSNPEGAVYKSPQALLDSMMAHLAFDPIKFRDKPANDQVTMLLQAIGKEAELAELDAKRQGKYEARTEVKRTARALESTLADLSVVEGVEDGAQEKSLQKILDKIEAARAVNDSNESVRSNTRTAAISVEHSTRAVKDAEIALAEARAKLADEEKWLAEAQKAEALLPKDEDIEKLNEELAGLDDYNRKVRAHQQRAEVEAKLAAAENETEELTAALDAIAKEKEQIINSAELPLKGLGFGENGVTFDGVSLKDCSASKQLRVSVAMAMAMNPAVRVLLVRDGSLLDADAMQLLADMANEYDFQIFVERVDDNAPGAVVIEDGMVKQ